MYKLLLVDDEPTVRKGMLSCINWEKHGLEIAGEAGNGAAALAKALIIKPHIILTDIRMPVMDGIELSYKIREKMPNCRIIIMSGYDEFEYARKLMHIGITEYLLKPVVEEKLVDSIVKLIREIEYEERQKSYKKYLSNLLVENLPLLKSEFMKKLLCRAFPNNDDILRRAKVLNLPLTSEAREFVIVVAALDGYSIHEERTMPGKYESAKASVSNTIEERINKYTTGFVSYGNLEYITCLVCIGRDTDSSIELICNDFVHTVKERCGISILTGSGEPVQHLMGIQGSYDSAVEALRGRLHQGKRNFIKIVLKYVEENYDRDISLSEAARVAFITPNYLSRIFKEEMDINFIDWLNHLRVDKAKDLLMRTNLKTYEVAEKVGYRDYKYFSMVFKKITGSPPKEFKQDSGNRP
jgi:two-component system response regulator YesN